MTDTIFITGVVIHARHGVMEHETEVGQRFVIDLELSTDLSNPRAPIALLTRSPTPTWLRPRPQPFKNAITSCWNAPPRRCRRYPWDISPLTAIKVTVHKPHAPIAAIFETSVWSLTRTRQDRRHG